MTSPDAPMDARRAAARAAFEALRDQLHAALESLEAEAPQAPYPGAPGRFKRTAWDRPEGGGGVMGMLRGRLFEKAGVHVSTVHGTFPADYARHVPGAEADPRFFATGVSVILHPLSPHVPTAHMNCRFITTTRGWFGGGGDLTPMLDADRRDNAPDTLAFHAAMKAACDAHDPDCHARYKTWADDYFFLPHRNETRGTGGIFFDQHDTGSWDSDLAFALAVGDAFLEAYVEIVRRRMDEPWTADQRAEQQARRGRYVEFNLLYDRGTTFGLTTGGHVEAILSSMPPTVTWP